MKWSSLLTIGAVLFLWEIVCATKFVSPQLFPPPSKISLAAFELILSSGFWFHLFASLRRALAGFLLGGSSGIVIGLLTGRFQILDQVLGPVIQAIRPLPPVAIIPLVIVWLGIGELAKVLSISFAVFFPVWVGAHQGAKGCPRQFIWAARSLRLTRLEVLFRVVLPASLPVIVAGLRSGIAIAFVMVFVSELAGASSGVGYAINVYQMAYRTDRMMVYLALLGLSGAAADQLVIRVTNFCFPWIPLLES